MEPKVGQNDTKWPATVNKDCLCKLLGFWSIVTEVSVLLYDVFHWVFGFHLFWDSVVVKMSKTFWPLKKRTLNFLETLVANYTVMWPHVPEWLH
jgi:hypothetical protein